jgi:phosphate transport system substrate-binding protein
MRQRNIIVAMLLGLYLVLVLEAPFARSQQPDGTIRVRGSDAMTSLCAAWAREFSTANQGQPVSVVGGGTDMGLEALFDKTADLAMASRTILPKELQAAALSDCKPVEVPACRVLIAVITHPDNPVGELTLEDLGLILRGLYTRWNHVGGQDDPITIFTNKQTSGVALFLRTAVLENDYFSSDAESRDHYQEIITELSLKPPSAIAYAPLVDALKAEHQKQVKIVALKRDEKSPAVRPSLATFKDGSYPLILPLYFYWDDARVRPIVKKFVEFCKTKCVSHLQ